MAGLSADVSMNMTELAITLSSAFGVEWDEDVMRWEEPHIFKTLATTTEEPDDAER